MAKTKKQQDGKPVAQTEVAITPKKADKKKMIVVVLVIIAVAAIAVAVDSATRKPKVNNDLEATNRLLEMNVIADNPEIVYETPVEITESVVENIDGKNYYMIKVIADYDTDPKEFGPYYVAEKDGKIFTKDKVTGQLIPYGV